MPDSVFTRVGVDYAGPLLIKEGTKRKPVYVKSYVSVFVCLSIKAIHLELVTNLTAEAFTAALRRFISRRGRPLVIWSDNGSNFVGAANDPKALFEFLSDPKVQQSLSEFCGSENVQWKFIPERAPHFGGLWEAAVKSMKKHLKKTIGDAKLTYEELVTVLAQIESCMNSRPLTPLP